MNIEIINEAKDHEIPALLVKYWFGTIKEKGGIQSNFTEWTETIKSKNRYDQRKVSGILDRKNYLTEEYSEKEIIQKRRLLIDLLPFEAYLDALSSQEKMSTSRRSKKNSKHLRTRDKILDFVTERFEEEFVNDNKGPITINAIGIKLESLLASLISRRSFNALPKINLNLLLLSPFDEGVVTRNYLESRNNVQHSIASTIFKWKSFKTSFKSEYDVDQSEVTARLLRFHPLFYMIQIGDKMLVSPYLIKRGSDTFFNLYDSQSKNAIRFDMYTEAFRKYFDDDNLSIPLDWERDYAEEAKKVKFV